MPRANFHRLGSRWLSTMSLLSADGRTLTRKGSPRVSFSAAGASRAGCTANSRRRRQCPPSGNRPRRRTPHQQAPQPMTLRCKRTRGCGLTSVYGDTTEAPLSSPHDCEHPAWVAIMSNDHLFCAAPRASSFGAWHPYPAISPTRRSRFSSAVSLPPSWAAHPASFSAHPSSAAQSQ